MRTRNFLLPALSLVVAGVVACGSGGGGYMTGTTTSTGGGGGGGGGASGPVVSIVDYSFSPSSVSIKVGTTVTWTNSGSVAHTTTSDQGVWNSGQIAAASGGGIYGGGTAAGSYSYTFGTAGTYTYHCMNHPQMTGTITVTQ